MINQFEITMDNEDKLDPIVVIRVVVEGMERNTAILFVEEKFPNFKIRYIIAGSPR